MGAWGAGSFENDAAMDFASEIERAEDLLKPLTVETPDTPIDADHASRIIVVAECVAAMRGHPHADMANELRERVSGFGRPSKSLFHHARDHLAAVLERSELRELWDESGAEDFVEANHELIGRLNKKVRSLSAKEREPVYADSPCVFCDERLGSEEIADLNVTYNKGKSSNFGFVVMVHLACLNRALHPKFRKRPFTMHEEDMPEGEDGLIELLDSKPKLEN